MSRFLLLLTLLSVATLSSAADAPLTAEPAAEEETPAAILDQDAALAEEIRQAEAAAASAASSSPSGDTFVPSEQISEDLSVAFPVDI